MKRTITSLMLAAITCTAQGGSPIETHKVLPKAKAMLDSLKEVLPPEHKAIAALQNHPRVREARLKFETRQIEAKMLRDNPHEWEAGVAFRNRKDRTSNAINTSTQDQEVSLSRSLLLPGKQRIQQRKAAQVETLGEYELGDALHEASLALGTNWLECQRLESRAVLYGSLEKELQQFSNQQMKRFKAGEVSRVEANQADLLLQQLQIERQQNNGQLRTKRSELKREFPDLPTPNAERQCGEPRALGYSETNLDTELELTESEQREWITAMQQVNHPLLIQVTHTEILREQSALASAERLADPKLGVSFAREQNNAEQIIGFHISLPFGGSTRNNQLQLVNRELGQAEIALQTLQALSQEQAVRNIADWEQAKHLADTARNQSVFTENLLKSIEKAYWLGETTATELTLARQQAQRSRMEAIDREYNAMQAQTKLLVNAHQAWD